MLGKLSVQRRPTYLDDNRAKPYNALAVGAGGGCLDIFSLDYHYSLLSPSLWETARYRLKYWLKGPLSPKQPTSQSVYNSPKGSLKRNCIDRSFIYKGTKLVKIKAFYWPMEPVSSLCGYWFQRSKARRKSAISYSRNNILLTRALSLINTLFGERSRTVKP